MTGLVFSGEWHPGRVCGEQDDGSVCYTQGDAHFMVPPEQRAAPEPLWHGSHPSGWEGWEDTGFVDETGTMP